MELRAPTIVCVECHNPSLATHEDPRVPPVAEHICLCRSCFERTTEVRVEELEYEIQALRDALNPRPKRDANKKAKKKKPPLTRTRRT